MPTKVSQLENDALFLTEHQDISGKQDVISDLEAIRSGAKKGETALQSVPDTYRTAAAQDVIDAGKAEAGDVESLSEKVEIARADIARTDNILEYGSVNLFNPNDEDTVRGQYIQAMSDGEAVWEPLAGCIQSGYIPFDSTKKLYRLRPNGVSTWLDLRMTFYDSDKNLLYVASSGTGNAYVSTTNTKVAYIRFPATAIDLTASGDFKYSVYSYEPVTKFYPYGGNFLRISAIEESVNANQWKGKTWYAYGTSISNISNEGKYPTYLAQLSGMTLVCKGISGGGIGNLGAYSTGQVYSAICNTTDGKLNADLITLEIGANDTGNNAPLGTVWDTGTATLAGCLNDCLRYLLVNTNAQIAVICSPATTALPTAESHAYYEWADMVRQICDINRVHYLNNNCNMGAAKLAGSNGSLYVVDNIHHTALGGYIMAQNMWYQLKQIPLFYTAMPS